MRKDDRIFLQHIIESIEKIEKFVKGISKKEFLKNELIQDAVIRRLEIIGEATRHISQKLKKENLKIPWKEISALRDKLINQYFGVDLDLTWKVIEKDLPKLKKMLKEVVRKVKK